MKKWAGFLAAALSMFGAIGHMFNGGRAIADPLLTNSSLSLHDSSMLWMVWHVCSFTFIGMSILYAYGSYYNKPDFIKSALLITVLIGIIGLAAPIYLNVGFKMLPNGLAFIIIAIFGYISIFKIDS